MFYPIKSAGQWVIGTPNIVVYPNQPFNIMVGYINDYSKILNLFDNPDVYITAYDDDTVITMLDNRPYSYQISCSTTGTHGVNVRILSLNKQYSYYFVVSNIINTINEQKLYNVLVQELPSSYNKNIGRDIINYLDNLVSAKVLMDYYNVLYDLANQQYPEYVPRSLQYNINWEYALFGVKQILHTTQFPNKLLSLVYQVTYLTGCTKFDILLFISRYVLYYLNEVAIVTIDNSNNIIIYVKTLPTIRWVLGDPTLSILGSTTILRDNDSSPCEWLLLQLMLKLYPVQFNFNITWIQVADFNTLFTFIGYTYNGDFSSIDPKYGLMYVGDEYFPINLKRWTKI